MKMLSSALFAAATCLGAAAMAEDAQAQRDKNCVVYGDLAENVMRGRQKNVPMSKMMTIMSKIDNSAEGEAARKITRQVIVTAYSKPAMMTPENQARSIADFRNEVEAACYSAQ